MPQTLQTVYLQIAAADLDGDGRTDLAAMVRIREGSAGTSETAELRVLRQRSDRPGRFSPWQRLPLTSHQGALTAAELDGDGRIDLVVTDVPAGRVRIYLQDAAGDGPFSLVQTLAAAAPTSIETVDVDLDGAADIVVATARGVVAFRQDGRARGEFPEALSVVIDGALDPQDALTTDNDGLAVGDLGGNGLVDVASARLDRIRLYRHDAAVPGTFAGEASIDLDLAVPGALSVADVDQDGLDDLVAAGDSGGPVFAQPVLRIRRQDRLAPGTLLPAYGFDLTERGEPQRLAVADLTGDGRPDVVIAKLYTIDHGFVEVLASTGPPFALRRVGTFATLTLTGVDPHLRGLAVADLNGDGLLDVAVTDGELSVLFNDPAAPGHLLPAVAVVLNP